MSRFPHPLNEMLGKTKLIVPLPLHLERGTKGERKFNQCLMAEV